MEKIYIIADQTAVDPSIINWLRSAFPHLEIDIICPEGSSLEDQSQQWVREKNLYGDLIREVKW